MLLETVLLLVLLPTVLFSYPDEACFIFNEPRDIFTYCKVGCEGLSNFVNLHEYTV